MEAETRRGLTLALVLFVVAFAIAVFWVRSANGEDLKPGPGGCPVPWSVDWCMMQVGNIRPDTERTSRARAICSFLNPLPTKAGCFAAMAKLNKEMEVFERSRTPAAESRKSAMAIELSADEDGKRLGVGYRLAPGTRACWGDTTGRCPAWLAELGGGSCCGKVDLTVIDPVLEALPCDGTSGASGATSLAWVTARYKKPQLGILLGWGQELFWMNRSVLACRFEQGVLGGSAYNGTPSHRECYDLAATERKPPNACAVVTPPPPPPPPPVLCPNGRPDPGETCWTCPQDLGPCPIPLPPAAGSKEAAEWLERLRAKLCASVPPADLVSRQACAVADSLLLVNPLREAAGTVFLRARTAARVMTPRTYCLEIAGQAPRTVEVSGESGAFAMPTAGVAREGKCP